MSAWSGGHALATGVEPHTRLQVQRAGRQVPFDASHDKAGGAAQPLKPPRSSARYSPPVAATAIREAVTRDGQPPQLRPKDWLQADDLEDPLQTQAEEEQERRKSINGASTSGAPAGPNGVSGEPIDTDSEPWVPLAHYLSRRQLWAEMQREARSESQLEAALASYMHSNILMHATLEKSMSFLLANKLASDTLLSTGLMRIISEAYAEDEDLLEACSADIQAVRERDPACETYVQAVLFFKGFQAIQCHRIAHWLWKQGRKAFAIAIQSRISQVFHVDIHPAAQLGRGVMIDHATGVVIGETARVGDNVSLLHHVTLGGSGINQCKRHPTIGNGVLLGAGVSVLGPVKIGTRSKVGAGSVVVTDLPAFCVAVGVPARIIKRNYKAREEMDQCYDFILDYVI